ncbi:MAG: BrnT family toxin [Acidobacteriota bacterium]
MTWDPRKDQANKRKHKIGFEEAATVFYDPLSLTVDDPEHSTYVSFFESRTEIRIISAQKPTKRERNYYEEGSD